MRVAAPRPRRWPAGCVSRGAGHASACAESMIQIAHAPYSRPGKLPRETPRRCQGASEPLPVCSAASTTSSWPRRCSCSPSRRARGSPWRACDFSIESPFAGRVITDEHSTTLTCRRPTFVSSVRVSLYRYDARKPVNGPEHSSRPYGSWVKQFRRWDRDRRIWGLRYEHYAVIAVPRFDLTEFLGYESVFAAPYWAVLIATGILPLEWLITTVSRRRLAKRLRSGRCVACGYSAIFAGPVPGMRGRADVNGRGSEPGRRCPARWACEGEGGLRDAHPFENCVLSGRGGLESGPDTRALPRRALERRTLFNAPSRRGTRFRPMHGR